MHSVLKNYHFCFDGFGRRSFLAVGYQLLAISGHGLRVICGLRPRHWLASRVIGESFYLRVFASSSLRFNPTLPFPHSPILPFKNLFPPKTPATRQRLTSALDFSL